MSTVTQFELLRKQLLTGEPRVVGPKSRLRERWSDALATLAIVGLSLILASEVFRLFVQ